MNTKRHFDKPLTNFILFASLVQSQHFSIGKPRIMSAVEWMKLALNLAIEAFNVGEVPVGCVFVKNNTVICSGRNSTNLLCNATQHAELVAMRELVKKHGNLGSLLTGADLYVTVEPCIMCAAALRMTGIRRVFYGCANEHFGGTGSVLSVHDSLMDGYEKYEIECGMMKNQSISLLRKFYLKENCFAPNPTKKRNRVFKDPENE